MDIVPILKQVILKSHLKWYPTRVSNECSSIGEALPRPKKNLSAWYWIWLTLGRSLKAQRWVLNSIIGETVASKIREKMEKGNPPLNLVLAFNRPRTYPKSY